MLSVETRGKIVVLKLIGESRKENFEQAIQLLDEKIEGNDSPRLLVDMRRYDGAADLSTAWAEFKLVATQGDKVDKVAVIGSLDWQKLATLVVSPFTKATERFFEPDDIDDALEWLVD